MQSNSVIFWWNLGPRIHLAAFSAFWMAVDLSRCVRVAGGERGSVLLNGWSYSWWVSGDWRCTETRCAGGRILSLQLNKDVNKGRVREWKGCRERVLLISILSVAEIRFIIGNISSRLHHTVVLPPVTIFIYAFGKTSLMYLACIQDIHFISQARGLSFTTALPNEL